MEKARNRTAKSQCCAERIVFFQFGFLPSALLTKAARANAKVVSVSGRATKEEIRLYEENS
jgi:hypothetical protein